MYVYLYINIYIYIYMLLYLYKYAFSVMKISKAAFAFFVKKGLSANQFSRI